MAAQVRPAVRPVPTRRSPRCGSRSIPAGYRRIHLYFTGGRVSLDIWNTKERQPPFQRQGLQGEADPPRWSEDPSLAALQQALASAVRPPVPEIGLESLCRWGRRRAAAGSGRLLRRIALQRPRLSPRREAPPGRGPQTDGHGHEGSQYKGSDSEKELPPGVLLQSTVNGVLLVREGIDEPGHLPLEASRAGPCDLVGLMDQVDPQGKQEKPHEEEQQPRGIGF